MAMNEVILALNVNSLFSKRSVMLMQLCAKQSLSTFHFTLGFLPLDCFLFNSETYLFRNKFVPILHFFLCVLQWDFVSI